MQLNSSLEFKIKDQLMKLENTNAKKREVEDKLDTVIDQKMTEREKCDFEQKNNIKLIHQLKKAHKTIDEMKKVIEGAEKKVGQYKNEIEQVKIERELEQVKWES